MNEQELEPVNPDAEAVYDREIAPLMDQIIAICKANRIPVFASFQFGTSDDGADFCTTRIPFKGESDKFARYVRIALDEPVTFGIAITTGRAGECADQPPG